MDLLGLAFIGVFLAALGVGRLVPRASPFFARAMLPIVVVLVFTISMWGGNSIRTVRGAASLLAYSAAYAVSTMFLGYSMGLGLGGVGRGRGVSGAGPPRLGLVFVLDLAVGWAVGSFVELPRPESIITGELYVLAGVVGLGLGGEVGRGALGSVGVEGVKAVGLAVAGSLLAGLVLSPILRVPLRASLAVALGFGWYTFDGPAVAAYAGPYLGVMAFLANFLREQLTFAVVPLLPGNPAALISMGGATTMDDTLPLYAAVLGREYSIPAMVNGLILTLIVPVVIPLILAA
ncbi:hypothetical protein GCM10007981_00740 [Thermocladium modestius]|uniref:Lysine exporter LysO family protein n=1 Tax=Thermocladium modestius TaxID=62609 RepID=A0A830GSR6_9CREN|nr:lysine exporter LysO family protein [Thermocladium modestius]GGP18966.1 hypothetical protein GCM10007981_00740 [Thermocladium modestius]